MSQTIHRFRLLLLSISVAGPRRLACVGRLAPAGRSIGLFPTQNLPLLPILSRKHRPVTAVEVVLLGARLRLDRLRLEGKRQAQAPQVSAGGPGDVVRSLLRQNRMGSRMSR